jgi:4-amino-4-deoxy-L-arabinose transferase-like glycosyltransferase
MEEGLAERVNRPDVEACRLGPALFAAATFALHFACLGRYGIFRDELYFLVCGERLAPGYVDEPPGIALVARLAMTLFGSSVLGLRLFAWLADAATVYLTGRLARRLGGRGPAVTLASAAALACLLLRGTSHMLTMNAFEPLLMLSVVHLVLRLSQGEDPRLWVAACGLAGLAVLMKYGSAVLALSLLLGVAVSPGRRSLRTRWFPVGVAFGLLLVLPNFVWQAAHGFPFVELIRNGVRYKNAPMSLRAFLGGVLFEANPGNAPLWLLGLGWLLIAREARPARFAGLGGLLYLALLAIGRGKPYYATPLFPIFLAAGGAAFATIVHSRRASSLYAGGLVASALLFAPLAVPILPVKWFIAYQGVLGMKTAPVERRRQGVLPQVYADQFGWREIAAAVARVYESLPAGEREHALVFANNYGVASAVEILGPEYGLPRGLAISGHNQYWFWGVPAGRGDPVIVVSGAKENCGGVFREKVLGEVIPSDPYVMPDEDHHSIWICRGAPAPFTAMPEALRHFE